MMNLASKTSGKFIKGKKTDLIPSEETGTNKRLSALPEIKSFKIEASTGTADQNKKAAEVKLAQKPVPKVGLENGELPTLVKRDLTRTFGHHRDWGGDITLQEEDIKRIQNTVENVLKAYLSEGNGREYIQGLGSICLAIVHAFYVGEKTLWYSNHRESLLAVCPHVFTERNITSIFTTIMHTYGHANAFENNFEKLNEGCDRMFNLIKIDDNNLFEQLFPDGVYFVS